MILFLFEGKEFEEWWTTLVFVFVCGVVVGRITSVGTTVPLYRREDLLAEAEATVCKG